jgi:hypothetical protein
MRLGAGARKHVAESPEKGATRMARPTKTENERRTEQVKIRLTLSEVEHLREQALITGMTVAHLVRRRALSLPVQPTPSRVDAQLLSELNRIGVNVNQLARSANTNRDFGGDWQAIQEELVRLLAAVSQAYDS